MNCGFLSEKFAYDYATFAFYASKRNNANLHLKIVQSNIICGFFSFAFVFLAIYFSNQSNRLKPRKIDKNITQNKFRKVKEVDLHSSVIASKAKSLLLIFYH